MNDFGLIIKYYAIYTYKKEFWKKKKKDYHMTNLTSLYGFRLSL